VTELRRRPCPSASSYSAEIVTARLDTGGQVTAFFKDLGASRFPKDQGRRRRDRERKVYRDLLGGRDAGELGTPRYYGSVWNEATGRFWLFVEFVEGTELRFCEVGQWIAAAGWLGRLHGHFHRRTDRLATSGFLVRHDVGFFLSAARLARRAVDATCPELAGRLERALGGYDRLVGVMTRQAPTLVHGHFRPCNIVVSDKGDGGRSARICPVDWEQAAVGSALYDLAYLTDGFEPPVLERFFDAYRGEAEARGVRVPPPDELRLAVDCFRFFMPLQRLSRARERGLAGAKIEKTIALLERIKPEPEEQAVGRNGEEPGLDGQERDAAPGPGRGRGLVRGSGRRAASERSRAGGRSGAGASGVGAGDDHQ
jgi:hypothetical protein